MAENIWEYICGEDIAVAMRLVGCDEKYISGNASDYEKFRELMSILALFDGCEILEKCCEKIGFAIGEELTVSQIKEISAIDIWQKYPSHNTLCCDKISPNIRVEKDNYKSSCRVEDITVDYLNNSVDVFSLAGAFLDASLKKVKIEERLENPIIIHFFEGKFNRPDRYSAEKVFKKISFDEKCNNYENNIFLCQLVCEIIYAKKDNYPTFIFDIKNGSECVEGLIKYLVKRSLEARIYLLADQSVPLQEVRRICLCGNRNCFVTPVVFENDSEYLKELARIYPSGLIIHK